jgi:hypothetical protein
MDLNRLNTIQSTWINVVVGTDLCYFQYKAAYVLLGWVFLNPSQALFGIYLNLYVLKPQSICIEVD